jgi:tRNA pseudouridine32 synthase / 23S rRNA pseudouridine746 synthase
MMVVGNAAESDPMFTKLVLADPNCDLPAQLAYSFAYEPHGVAKCAADQLKQALLQDHESDASLAAKNGNPVGKMLGVLVVKRPKKHHQQEQGKNDFELGFLKAISGTLSTTPPGFCPMIYDSQGIFPRQGETTHSLNAMNEQIEQLETCPEFAQKRAVLDALLNQSQQALAQARQQAKRQKETRRLQRGELQQGSSSTDETRAMEERLRQESAAIQRQLKALKLKLQEDITVAQQAVDEWRGSIEQLKQRHTTALAQLQKQHYEQYQFWNCHGERKSLVELFAETPIPAGAGDCAAPKLFQHAFQMGYHPIALAEFWWGKSPPCQIRKHNFYYPACRGKCQPILEHMLQGLNVEDNPLNTTNFSQPCPNVEVLYEDNSFVVVNKPSGMLSVPGRYMDHSLYTIMKQRYPNATGPLLVHRIDMSTSGIVLVAKDKVTHKKLQAQFIHRTITKRYTALLEGELDTTKRPRKGTIDIPIGPDYHHRPMQMVDFSNSGKPAVTHYEILEIKDGRTLVHFVPVTGRTHQIRVHAAHEQGLNLPIVGDDIYGQRDNRLCLHAGFIELTHPMTQERMSFVAEVPF